VHHRKPEANRCFDALVRGFGSFLGADVAQMKSTLTLGPFSAETECWEIGAATLERIITIEPESEYRGACFKVADSEELSAASMRDFLDNTRLWRPVETAERSLKRAHLKCRPKRKDVNVSSRCYRPTTRLVRRVSHECDSKAASHAIQLILGYAGRLALPDAVLFCGCNEGIKAFIAVQIHHPLVSAFTLAKPLLVGLTYRYDWGFIPSTQVEDGDPLAVLIIHDAATRFQLHRDKLLARPPRSTQTFPPTA
jgi:hypothetical protein